MVNEAESIDGESPSAGGTSEKSNERTWKTRLRKFCIRAGVALLLLLLAGFAWDQIATWNFLRNYPPPGEILEIDGTLIHAVIRGEREPGQPAIVIEPRMDAGTSEWLHIVSELENHSQVVVMDRRGMGYSASGGGVRTPDQNVADLRKVLESKSVAPPYLLVGHSLGGHNIRLFQSLYADEVAGMVLVDAVNTDHLTNLEDSGPPFFLRCVAATGRFGLTRGMGLLLRPNFPQDDGVDYDRIAGNYSRGRTPRAVLNLWYGTAVGWKERRSRLNRVVDVPVTVIAAKGPPIGGMRWSEGQKLLREISPEVKYIDTGGHHNLDVRKPDLITSEILSMLDNL